MLNTQNQDHSEQEQAGSQRKVVEAHEFRLLGPENELRGWFRTLDQTAGEKKGTLFSIFCLNEEMEQVNIRTTDDGETVMQFLNRDACLMKFGVMLSPDRKLTPTIEIGDPLSADSTYLSLSVNDAEAEVFGSPRIELRDRKGTMRALLTLGPDGEAHLILFDENAKEVKAL